MFLACSHHRGACTGSTPASSCLEPKGRGCALCPGFLRGGSRGLWENEPSATKLLLKCEDVTKFKRCCKTSQQNEAFELTLDELHVTCSLHHLVVQSLFVHFINLMTQSSMSRYKPNASIISSAENESYEQHLVTEARTNFCMWSGKLLPVESVCCQHLGELPWCVLYLLIMGPNLMWYVGIDWYKSIE